MQKLLKEKKPSATKREIQEAFAVLTTPAEKSLAKKEAENLVRLAGEAEKNALLRKAFDAESSMLEERLREFPEFLEKVDRHAAEYGFLTYGPNGPGNTAREYLSIISLMLKEKNPPAAEAAQDARRIEKTFNLGEKEKLVFAALRKNVWFQGYRKDNLFEWWQLADRMLAELAKRKNLSIAQIRRTAPWEFRRIPSEKELGERVKHLVGRYDNGLKILSGKAADDFMSRQTIERPNVKEVKEFYGNCACSGFARGKVKIINTREDMRKMEKGDVLVSCATSPDLMPASGPAITRS
jgi:phosphoenolpyruvate synthase/pyruvate phosphate dikinase